MADTIIVKGADIMVDIPNFSGALSPHLLIWMIPVLDNYYEASLQNKDKGFTMWLIKIDENKNIIPLSCTLYFNSDEAKILRLADKLHLPQDNFRQQIYEKRIEKETI